MAIGTAKPSEEQLRLVPHHFIGHLSVRDDYNVAAFEADALNVLNQIFSNKDAAILAGGSGLYIDAVCHGIDTLPDPPADLREMIRKEWRDKGIARLQQWLSEVDPEYFAVVDRQNPMRLIRALEVSLTTGKPYSSFLRNRPLRRDFRIIKFGLEMKKEELHERIGRRVDRMMEAGLLQEVISLLPFRDLNALNTVGYRELFEFLDGRWSLEEAVEKIKTSTRRYAKRQMTWFRRDGEIIWVRAAEELEEILPSVMDSPV